LKETERSKDKGSVFSEWTNRSSSKNSTKFPEYSEKKLRSSQRGRIMSIPGTFKTTRLIVVHIQRSTNKCAYGCVARTSSTRAFTDREGDGGMDMAAPSYISVCPYRFVPLKVLHSVLRGCCAWGSRATCGSAPEHPIRSHFLPGFRWTAQGNYITRRVLE